MIKKIINYVVMISLAFGLIIPVGVSAATSISSATLNATNNETTWAASTNAKPGDVVGFRITFTNQNTTSATNLGVKASMPAGLGYLPGYAKMYSLENGVTKTTVLSDAIAASTGAALPSVAPNTYVLVTYRAKVSSGAMGVVSPNNQIVGDGISIASSNATVNVSGTTVTTPVVTNPVVVTTPLTGTNSGIALPAASIISSLKNITKGDTIYSTAVNANRGDEIIYRVTLTNNGDATATGLHMRTQMPSGLEYIPGYAKFYYKDANGADQQLVLDEALGANSGANLPDVPAHHFVYITYKVKVKSTAVAGTYSASNQVSGNSNISLADNAGVVTVFEDGTIVPSVQKSVLSLNATAYDSTLSANANYSNSVNANRGDTIKFRVNFANNGDAVLKNAKITSSLPANMEYIAGSAKTVINGISNNVPDNKTVSLGDLSVGANGTLEFSAKIKSETPQNITQLAYTADGTADGIAKVSSVVNIYLAGQGQKGDVGSTTLPSTGPAATTILALVILAMFISVASYMYLKESNALNGAVKLIKR